MIDFDDDNILQNMNNCKKIKVLEAIYIFKNSEYTYIKNIAIWANPI